MEVLGALVRVGREGGNCSKVVEKVVMRLMERKEKVTETECYGLGDVWRLGKSGFLDLDLSVLVKVLETCTETFVAEIEAMIVEALENEKFSSPLLAGQNCRMEFQFVAFVSILCVNHFELRV